MRAVHIGVGHEDDLAVPQLGSVEIFCTDARSQCGDHGADFFVTEHLVVACLLYVQDLALKRQDLLETAIAALLSGTTCAFTLDQIHLAAFRLTLRAVGQLARQPTTVERALAASEITGFARSLARTRCFNGFVDDLLCYWRVLVEEGSQAFVDE